MNCNRFKFIASYFWIMVFAFIAFLMVAFLNQYFVTSLVYDPNDIACSVNLDTAELILLKRQLMADGLVSMPHDFIAKYWGYVVLLGNILAVGLVWSKKIVAPKHNDLVGIFIISLSWFGLSFMLGNLSSQIMKYHNATYELTNQVMLAKKGVDIKDPSLSNNLDLRHCFNSNDITIDK